MKYGNCPNCKYALDESNYEFYYRTNGEGEEYTNFTLECKCGHNEEDTQWGHTCDYDDNEDNGKQAAIDSLLAWR